MSPSRRPAPPSSPQPRSPHSWFTFQLAFILMQLPLLTDPAAAKRSGGLATAQLLFFPTGGGKTEAYLGLAAYAFAIRRRQAVVDTPGRAARRAGRGDRADAVHPPAADRAAVPARHCARLRGRGGPPPATKTPGGKSRSGSGSGSALTCRPKRFEEAETQLKKASTGGGYRLTVLQVQRCPWCGSKIDVRDLHADPRNRRIYVYCGDELAGCPFSRGGDAEDGLPILTVDEEIYRLAPAFVIATVDKFARLAREGEAASLFGYVSRRCERHGYVHPDYQHCDVKDGSKHPPKDGLPAAAVRPVTRLRPPDLIIQDELHLITGALGTTVGLFEVAIDALDLLANRRRPAGPAAARRLHRDRAQLARAGPRALRAIGGDLPAAGPRRQADVLLPRGAGHREAPGRRYIGISTTGIRLTTAEIRISRGAAGRRAAAARPVAERRSTGRRDPYYLTLVGYFSATQRAGRPGPVPRRRRADRARQGRPWSGCPGGPAPASAR